MNIERAQRWREIAYALVQIRSGGSIFIGQLTAEVEIQECVVGSARVRTTCYQAEHLFVGTAEPDDRLQDALLLALAMLGVAHEPPSAARRFARS